MLRASIYNHEVVQRIWKYTTGDLFMGVLRSYGVVISPVGGIVLLSYNFGDLGSTLMSEVTCEVCTLPTTSIIGVRFCTPEYLYPRNLYLPFLSDSIICSPLLPQSATSKPPVFPSPSVHHPSSHGSMIPCSCPSLSLHLFILPSYSFSPDGGSQPNLTY